MCNEKSIFLFLNQKACCMFSKEPSQWDWYFGKQWRPRWNAADPDEMQHNAVLHQGLHSMLCLKPPSGAKICHTLEPLTCDPLLKYTMYSPILIVSICRHRIFYGVESWSGVLEQSIRVEWSQWCDVCVWPCFMLSCNSDGSVTHTHHNCTPFYFCHSKIWLHSTPILDSKTPL